MKSRLEKLLINSCPRSWWSGIEDFPRTPISFGLEVGDGWARLLYTLFKELKFITQNTPDIIFNFAQIKEKYGTLRIYYYGGNDEMAGALGMTEAMSAFICEVCGSTGKVRGTGWYTTLCGKHWKEHKNNH